MSYYAKVRDGLVVEVIRADADFFDTFVDTSPGQWLQTSYNTRGGVYYLPDSDIPNSDQSKTLRKNYAGIGFAYDSTRDAFIPPKPYTSWTLVEETCQWAAPVAMPNDGKIYAWNEDVQNWVEAT